MALIHALFDDLLARGASDLHLAVGQPPLCRRRGELEPLREGAPLRRRARLAALRDREPPRSTRASWATSTLDFAYAYGDKAPLPRQLFLQDLGPGRRLPHHPEPRALARRSGLPRRHPPALRTAAAGSSSAPGPPARARAPPWRRCSTTSTGPGPATSSPSRIRWSSCTSPSAPRSPTARSAVTRGASPPPSAAPARGRRRDPRGRAAHQRDHEARAPDGERGHPGLPAPCTPTARRRPSSGSSTPSPPTSSPRSAGCWPRAWR